MKKMVKNKTAKKLLLALLSLVMLTSVSLGVISASASMVPMSSVNVEYDLAFDDNGVSPVRPDKIKYTYGQGSASNTVVDTPANFGMTDPATNYEYHQDGSEFVLSGGTFMLLGYNGTTDIDLAKEINLTFTLDPGGSWADRTPTTGDPAGFGRMGFALYADTESAMRNGTNMWALTDEKIQNNTGADAAQQQVLKDTRPKAFISFWPEQFNNKGVAPDPGITPNTVVVHTLDANGGEIKQASSAIPMTSGSTINISILVGADANASYVKVNGTKIADLGLDINDFIPYKQNASNRFACLSMAALHVTTEFKLHVSQKANATVAFNSPISGYTAPATQNLYVGQSAKLPADPSVSGYTFNGWYLDEYRTVKYEGERLYGQNTLYAKFLDNSKTDYTVTLKSRTGGYSDVQLKFDQGAIFNAGNVFKKAGYDIVWKTEQGADYAGTAINQNVTLYADWVEKELALYQNINGTRSNSLATPTANDFGIDVLTTKYEDRATYETAQGETIIPVCYGAAKGLEVSKNFSSMQLQSSGSTVNVNKLDVTKEIVVKVNIHNWDYNFLNNNYSSSSAANARVSHVSAFQLFDTLETALRAGHEYGRKNSDGSLTSGAKASIAYSTFDAEDKYGNNFYGKFADVINDVNTGVQGNLSYQRTQTWCEQTWFTIKMYISADGTGNYVVIERSITDSEGMNEKVDCAYQIDGALAGLKQSDFVDGYAYLQIANSGASVQYNVRVAQSMTVTTSEKSGGTYQLTYLDEGDFAINQNAGKEKTVQEGNAPVQIRYGAPIKIRVTPDAGSAVAYVKVGNQTLSVSQTDPTVYEGYLQNWGDAEIDVMMSAPITITFDTRGGMLLVGSPTITNFANGGILADPGPAMSLTGDIFSGWYTDLTFTTPVDFSQPIFDTDGDGMVTIYAAYASDLNGTIPGGGNNNNNGGNTNGGGNTSGGGNTNGGGNTSGGLGCGGSISAYAMIASVLVLAGVGAVIVKSRKKEN